ncbi:unnamed protein product [Paramecium octaurelia]|uniref:Transmembrane protein n=1 Tax=Paramecium octaurelia TaxID=43137 RepID=A0A8S1S2C0_PAROT|nr:unnamed protein product [Paramecium octaurelia]
MYMASKQKLIKLSAMLEQWIKTTYLLNQQLKCPNVVNQKQVEQNIIYKLLQIFIRPDIIIIQNGYFHGEFYIILLIIWIIQKLLFILICLLNSYYETYFKKLLLQDLFLYVLQIITYYQCFLGIYFILPISRIFLFAFYQSVQEIQEGIPSSTLKSFLCVLGQLMYTFDIIYFMKIDHHPTTYKTIKCKQFQISNFDYYILKFRLLQVIIADQNESLYLQQIEQITIILIALLQIINQIRNCGYIYEAQKKIFLSCQAFLIMSGIYNIMNQSGVDQQDIQLLFFITIPSIIYILYKFQEQQDNKYFTAIFLHKSKDFKQMVDLNINQILYQLVRILNNCDCGTNYKNFKQSLIYFHHKKKCKIANCVCELDYYITESTQINATTSLMINNFMKSQYKQLIKKLFLVKMKNQVKQDLLISTAILLHDFNQMMVSLQILSQLKKSKENKIFNVSFLYHFMNQKDYKENEQTKIRIMLSTIEQIQINLVLQQSRIKFEANLGTSLRAASQTLISQTNQQELILGMKECVRLKIQFYEILDSDSGFTFTQLFKKVKETSKYLLKIEKQFNSLFTLSPDLQLQQAYCFFEAQIMNNLLAAFNIKQSEVNLKENQIKYRGIKGLNLSADVNSYILLSVDENFRTFSIIQSSHNFFRLFGMYFDLTTYGFNDIIPQFYIKQHENSVQNFFHSGQNKFYRNFNYTFIKTHNGLLKQVSLCIDNTQIFKLDKFIFVGLLQSVNTELPILVVDAQTQIVYFTPKTLQSFGINELQQKQFIEDGVLHQIGIQTVIPYYNMMIKAEVNTDIVTTFCFFLKPQYNQETILTQSSIRKDSNFFIWKNKENINCFSIEIKVEKVNLQLACYYQLEFISLKQILSHDERKKVLELYKPCLGESTTSKGSKWKGKHLKILSVLSFRQERKKNTLKLQDSNLKQSIMINQNQGQSKNLNQSSFIQQNQSQSNLLSSKARNEQEFYKSFNKSFVESDVQNSQLDREEHSPEKKKNKDGKASKANHQQIERIGQQSSSIAGFYRPFFYNRYYLIEKMSGKKNPKKIDSFLFFFIGQSLIFFIFSFLVMINMTSDMTLIIDNIEMDSLHASIMGPHDLFFSMRITVSSYQQMQREGFLTQNQMVQLTDPFYTNIRSGYLELKDSFYKQLRNEYLQEFFSDIVLNLRFMNENEKELQNMSTSFRESLLTILQYQYAHMRIIEQRQSTSGKPCQIFLMANYFLLHEKVELITQEIQGWLIDTKETIGNKGKIFWIILQLLLIIFGFIGLFNFNLYIKYYDQFLLIFNEFNKQLIYDQLNRYDLIHQQLQSNSDDIMKYNFELELYEHEKTQSQYGRGKVHHFKLLNRNRQHLSRFHVYSIIVLITVVYLVYTSVIYYKQETFLQKYNDTITLYKIIQDLKLKSGKISLRWDNFTFLTQGERDILYQYIDQSHKIIAQYIILSSTFDSSQYLVGSKFEDKFLNIQKNNICLEILDQLEEYMLFYCDKSFEGTLTKGLIEALNYITNSIKTQQQINNFTKRIEIQLYEQEGSQIVTRSFFGLSNLFLQSVKDTCNELNNFLIYFSLIYMLVSAFLIIFIKQLYRQYLINEYHQIRQSLFLIPKESILYDESLERYLREIALHQGLI